MRIDLDPATGGSIVHMSVEETGTILSALALGMITAKKPETRLAFSELHIQFRGEAIREHDSFEKRMDTYWENPR
jgi:hypothetical protein